MSSVNKVILLGNLGADPEIRSTSSGGRVATLSIATSRKWKNAAGEPQEKTQWHRVILWNNKGRLLADVAENYMKKGDKLYVEGEIEYRSYQDREGITKYTTEIIGRDVTLLSPKGDGTSAPRPTTAAPKGAQQSFEDFPEALDDDDDDDLPF